MRLRSETHRRKPVHQIVLPRVLEVGDRVEGVCVRWFDRGLGYGFISVDGAAAVFVSAREVQNAPALQRRDRVAFDVALDGQGRFQAKHVVLLDGMPITPMSVSTETWAPAPWEDA